MSNQALRDWLAASDPHDPSAVRIERPTAQPNTLVITYSDGHTSVVSEEQLWFRYPGVMRRIERATT